MSHTNSTTNYNLPQFIGTDTPGWLTDVNRAMADIDAAIYARQQGVATNANNISAIDSRLTNVENDVATAETNITDIQTDLTNLTDDVEANTTAIAGNTSNISALNTTVSAIQVKLPVQTDVTMLAASWANNEYAFTDAAVTASSIITIGVSVGCTASEMEAFNAAMLRPLSITAGTGFSVYADGDVPTIDIPVTIIREG